MQTDVVPRVHRLGSRFVNWFLVEDGGRLTAVDAGLPGVAGDLERNLHELGRRPEDVEAVLLTHSDADHTGVAGALREAGATVFIDGYDQGTLARPGAKGGDARPQNVVRDLWRPQAWRIGELDATVTLPGHGDPWHGPAAVLARRAQDAA